MLCVCAGTRTWMVLCAPWRRRYLQLEHIQKMIIKWDRIENEGKGAPENRLGMAAPLVLLLLGRWKRHSQSGLAFSRFFLQIISQIHKSNTARSRVAYQQIRSERASVTFHFPFSKRMMRTISESVGFMVKTAHNSGWRGMTFEMCTPSPWTKGVMR